MQCNIHWSVHTQGPLSTSRQLVLLSSIDARCGQVSPRRKKHLNFILSECQFTSIERVAIENVCKFHLNSIFSFRNEFLFPSSTLGRQLCTLNNGWTLLFAVICMELLLLNRFSFDAAVALSFAVAVIVVADDDQLNERLAGNSVVCYCKFFLVLFFACIALTLDTPSYLIVLFFLSFLPLSAHLSMPKCTEHTLHHPHHSSSREI